LPVFIRSRHRLAGKSRKRMRMTKRTLEKDMNASLKESQGFLKPWALGAMLGLITAIPFAASSFAMGDSGPAPSPSSPGTRSKGCPSGYKYNTKKKQCVKIACAAGEVWSKNAGACAATTAASVTDEDLRAEGEWLAKHGRYAEALETLRLVKQQNNPKVLNYIGYSTRKLGRVDEGIRYYLAALKLDPNYHVVREYLGEGYLQQGKPELAKEQLSELEKRCGKGCTEYRTLVAALAKGGAEW
jgi:predicted Zn-dependent protease